MPLYHCNNCHHEFEDYPSKGEFPICDWCGGGTYLLSEETGLSSMMNGLPSLIEQLGESFLNWKECVPEPEPKPIWRKKSK